MGPTIDGDGTIGVVGTVPGGATAALADADCRVVEGDPDDVVAADPEWIVAGGEAALLALVRAGVDRPVLPVAAGRDVGSASRADAAGAVAAVLAGEATERSRRLLSVRVDDEAATALLDVTVVTAEPAQISEYSVRSAGRTVARFRADGVVVATPAGSGGYASAAGGPVVEPGTDVCAVVPVAPFVTDADHWILGLDDVAVEVERDEPVSLVVDDREWRTLGRGATVRLTADGSLPLVGVPANQRDDAAAGLEKL